MEVLKNEGKALSHAEDKATKTDTKIQNSPENKADIFPLEKKARRECTLSDEMVKMLVNQMAHELENHNLYRTFSAYFHRNDLPKLGVYYTLRGNEENVHHNWIFNYLTECDANFTYPAVPAVNLEILDNVMPFKLTVDKEIETTLGINQLVNKAAEEGDWATFTFLMGDDKETGKLVKEQRNNISLAA